MALAHSQAEGDPGSWVIQKHFLTPSVLSLSKSLNGTPRTATRVLISPESPQDKSSGSQAWLCFRISLSTY